MKNKKLLNIFILLLSLTTLILDILLFAFTPYKPDANKFVVVLFWIFNSFMLLTLITGIILTLISLFMDDYIASKIIESFVFISFVFSFINLMMFAMSKSRISFLYVSVSLFAFITTSISQIFRLSANFKNWKNDFLTLVKAHKPSTVINATEKADKKDKKDDVLEKTENEKENFIIDKVEDKKETNKDQLSRDENGFVTYEEIVVEDNKNKN